MAENDFSHLNFLLFKSHTASHILLPKNPLGNSIVQETKWSISIGVNIISFHKNYTKNFQNNVDFNVPGGIINYSD